MDKKAITMDDKPSIVPTTGMAINKPIAKGNTMMV